VYFGRQLTIFYDGQQQKGNIPLAQNTFLKNPKVRNRDEV
jgi:hypothetical protein